MNMDIYNYFSTKDLSLASLCYAMNVPLHGIEKDGNICWFNFENPEMCRGLQQQFFSKSINVNAKDYADAMRTLKNLLFTT